MAAGTLAAIGRADVISSRPVAAAATNAMKNATSLTFPWSAYW